VVAARGPAVRTLSRELTSGISLPDGFRNPRVCLPGVVSIEGPRIEPRPRLESPNDESIWATATAAPWSADIERLTVVMSSDHPLRAWPLVVVVDDSDFAAASLENFLWMTFTRSNPAADVHGVDATVHQKHWGCRGPLVIDARLKPHHAPPVEEEPAVSARVDDLCRRGGPLAEIIGRA
jgi:4-hydroxy-3-polyprenylbenzoate decarboxylase